MAVFSLALGIGANTHVKNPVAILRHSFWQRRLDQTMLFALSPRDPVTRWRQSRCFQQRHCRRVSPLGERPRSIRWWHCDMNRCWRLGKLRAAVVAPSLPRHMAAERLHPTDYSWENSSAPSPTLPGPPGVSTVAWRPSRAGNRQRLLAQCSDFLLVGGGEGALACRDGQQSGIELDKSRVHSRVCRVTTITVAMPESFWRCCPYRRQRKPTSRKPARPSRGLRAPSPPYPDNCLFG